MAVVLVSASANGGCAAVFRESHPTMHVESDPSGALGMVKGATPTTTATPFDVQVPRAGISEVRVKQEGFEDHHGSVRKHVNGWWLTADLSTCILPVLLCVPLLVDAISGAWIDVEPAYTARLAPLQPMRSLPATPAPGLPPGPGPAPAAPSPVGSMSESERKSSARAAYLEGMELQVQGNHAEALGRFQYAQKVFDAPTHLLHIAQCLAATGKLVEAQETYETLARRELPPDAPGPFRESVEGGKRELSELRPRIPTLRIEVKPAPSTLRNLAVSMNGKPLPNEVLGIARPVNPGAYRLTATAWGIAPAPPATVQLAERDATTVELKLGK